MRNYSALKKQESSFKTLLYVALEVVILICSVIITALIMVLRSAEEATPTPFLTPFLITLGITFAVISLSAWIAIIATYRFINKPVKE
jgi:uncharacterized BrkB/YihY/UPF0761 family membrane protein